MLVRFAFSFWRPYPIQVKCRFKNVFDENTTFAQKILKRVILDQKMAVESKKMGFRTIAVAQMLSLIHI